MKCIVCGKTLKNPSPDGMGPTCRKGGGKKRRKGKSRRHHRMRSGGVGRLSSTQKRTQEKQQETVDGVALIERFEGDFYVYVAVGKRHEQVATSKETAKAIFDKAEKDNRLCRSNVKTARGGIARQAIYPNNYHVEFDLEVGANV